VRVCGVGVGVGILGPWKAGSWVWAVGVADRSCACASGKRTNLSRCRGTRSVVYRVV
jgi:hypothetical protein